MIELDYYWALLLLPLPLLIRYLMAAYGTERTSIKAPFFHTLASLTGDSVSDGRVVLQRSWAQNSMLAVVWLLLVLAAAKPVYIGEPIEIKKPARDLMIAVDLSGSMAEEDFAGQQSQPMSRLAGAKQVLAAFVEQREGDRFGLMVFADAPFLQLPFSQDKFMFRQLLQESQVRMAGAKTMLGDAIGFAYNHFVYENQSSELDLEQGFDLGSVSPKRNRVLLLLTDGNDSGSKIPPSEAAMLAASKKIKIYPVVLGDPEAGGEKAIDEPALQHIAEITGGQFFRASDAEALAEISITLNQLEPARFSRHYFYPTTELYYYPLLLVYLLIQLSSIISRQRRKLDLQRAVDHD